MKKDIIWTRSIGDWDEDRKLFPTADARVLHLPCIRIVARNVTAAEATSAAADPNVANSVASHVVFTSANAARYALRLPHLVHTVRKASAVYTHGKVTAAILRAAGIRVQFVEAKNGKSLGDFLVGVLPQGASLLWPCGEAVAHDFSPDLQAKGITVQRLVLYDTLLEMTDADARPLTAETRADLIQSLRGVVCFASPSSARCFIETLKPKENRLGTALVALAIGPTTAEEVQGHFAVVQVAREATVAALAADGLRYLSIHMGT
jgi:uroporphyrinogen-III synthase